VVVITSRKVDFHVSENNRGYTDSRHFAIDEQPARGIPSGVPDDITKKKFANFHGRGAGFLSGNAIGIPPPDGLDRANLAR
jgi:hypothetical protein